MATPVEQSHINLAELTRDSGGTPRIDEDVVFTVDGEDRLLEMDDHMYDTGMDATSPSTSQPASPGVFQPVAVQPPVSVDNPADPTPLRQPSAASGPPASRIVAPFQGEMEGELTVNVDELVRVISEAGGWTKVMKLKDEQVGLVPTWAVGGS